MRNKEGSLLFDLGKNTEPRKEVMITMKEEEEKKPLLKLHAT